MKNLLKKMVYATYKPISKLPTKRFSEYLIGHAYFIKNEAFYNNMKAEVVNDRLDMHELLSSKYIDPSTKICFLEFGVFKGQTFAIWVKNNKNPDSRFTGFDTFSGLPEDWGNIKKGTFSAEGKLPDIKDQRVDFKVGLIQNTLPEFAKSIEKGQKKVIHIDVDLYNATLISLIYIQPFLEKGDIIIFDDFFTITKASHEYRAFCDFLALYETNYKPLIKIRNGQVSIEIL